MGFVQLLFFKIYKKEQKSFLMISLIGEKRKSKHSFWEESTIWQWLKALRTKK